MAEVDLKLLLFPREIPWLGFVVWGGIEARHP